MSTYSAVHHTRPGQEPKYYTLPTLREQADIQDAWTRERWGAIPQLLKKYGVDAWLVSQREYAEDTVFWSLKYTLQMSSRRRTTMLFLANPSHDAPNWYVWVDNTPALWGELRGVLETQNPSSIAVNTHPQIAFSSGLHAGELDAIRDGIGDEWAARLVSEPMIAVEYVATMPAGRLQWYQRLQSTAWAMISEAFSEKVIQPGITTTTDVEWWLRDKLQQLNYTTWFHPDVTIIDEHAWSISSLERRSSLNDALLGGTAEDGPVIRHGDLLHVDFGVTAMGLNTDTQHLAYVLRPGETSHDNVPRGFLGGLRKGNRAQDIVKSHMKIGQTGNEILKASLDQMRREKIDGKVYCHPIGDWGHSAGTLIGMTNLQDGGVPVLGDLPLLPNTFYSVELLVRHFVPERNVTLSFPLEEDIIWNQDEALSAPWEWAFARQERFHLVQSPQPAHQTGGAEGHDDADVGQLESLGDL